MIRCASKPSEPNSQFAVKDEESSEGGELSGDFVSVPETIVVVQSLGAARVTTVARFSIQCSSSKESADSASTNDRNRGRALRLQ